MENVTVLGFSCDFEMWHNSDGQVRFDGLSFRSSLNPEGTNFVLFDVSPSRKYQICNSAVYQVNDLLDNSTCVLPLSLPESSK